jgi:hypothetical protein
MLSPIQEWLLLVKHPVRCGVGKSWRTDRLAPGSQLPWACSFWSYFTDTKADKPNSAACQTQPEARRNLLLILTLGIVGARGFEPPTSRTRTVRSSQAELRPVSV